VLAEYFKMSLNVIKTLEVLVKYMSVKSYKLRHSFRDALRRDVCGKTPRYLVLICCHVATAHYDANFLIDM
jgi:hypothetical protein